MTIHRPGLVLAAALGLFIVGIAAWAGAQQARPAVGKLSLPAAGMTLERVTVWQGMPFSENNASIFFDVVYRGVQETSGTLFFVFENQDGAVTLVNVNKVGAIKFTAAKKK